ncbi:hypothetical protein VK98_00055 [Chromobacterium sp. LK11]|uniref:type I polyketide synthase n=1 Tax=Chromobacterium sp. LK11 TaxID=1628212 RepID=UPI00065420B0|nr:type I polyketide synthase [Chromobacterium sp. LK11]KMN83862.1 hypothetical protein VK98_00055 [Chromobacterium sp. LK11]
MSKTVSSRIGPGTVDIAIVGMASHFPDAATLYDFWTNIVDKKDSLTDIDQKNGDEYWRKEDYYSADPSAADKTYGHRAGFVPAIDFDPVEFKLPPLMLESISTAQIFALHVAKQAMLDARLVGDDALPVDKDRVGVILGGAGNGNTSFSLAFRQQEPYLRKVLNHAGLPGAVADEVIDRVNHLYLEWNEDSFPGFLGNVACGRIASYFDLGGTSYMVDAACASSLAAIKAAVGELVDGSCDVVLTGGVNLENSIFSFLCFSKTPALSKSNLSRPFDESSDGMMLGDGVGFLVLKRLEDAERDGDRVYAVIKSLQASSDGRAKSIFAPRHEGQVKAMRRAYERAGISPAEIQLVEAHGTGTQSGDETEIKSLRAVFEAGGAQPGSVAIGSVKSQIGHTRCAAGAAAMMKAALSLYHKVLPPTINVSQPSRELADSASPFYVNIDSRPWLSPVGGAPRRAALSAYGFGGTNYHAIMEEHQARPQGDFRLNLRPEVVLLHADGSEQLLALAEHKLAAFRAEDAGYQFRLHQGAAARAPAASARLAFVAASAEQAAGLLDEAIKLLRARPDQDWEHPLGIYYKREAAPLAGRVVALFPGQGAQYVNMGRDIANDYPAMRETLEGLDAAAHADGLPLPSAAIFPPPAFDAETADRQMAELTQTRTAQPAIGAISAGYYKLLRGLGLRADFLAGHSYGEVTALWAAGVLSDEDFYRTSLARGAAVASPVPGGEPGAMLAASLPESEASAVLERFPELVVANYNSQQQLVFGGASDIIRQAHEFLNERKVRSQVLAVSAAFHTDFVRHACAPFEASLAGIPFQAPQAAVYSTASGERHADDPAKIKQSLIGQLVSPVRFQQTIERIHQQGGYLFIEIGPKGILGKLVADILKDKPHAVVSLNPSANGEEALQFKRALARLAVEGVELSSTDPQAALPLAAEPKKKALTYAMSGGFFYSEKAKQRRAHAMRKDTRVIDAFIDERLAASSPPRAPETERDSTVVVETLVDNRDDMMWLAPVHVISGEGIMQRSSSDNEVLSVLDAQIQAQNMLSQVHQQFQLNQKDYIQLLDSLMTKQYTLLEKFQGSQQLTEVVASLGQSLQLLDKNQELYHVNHEHYFDNQQALLGGDVAARGGQVTARLQQRAPLEVSLPTPRAAVELPAAAPLAQPVVVAAPAAQAAEVQAPKPTLQEIPQAVAPAAAPAPVAAPAAVAAAPAAAAISAEDQALIQRFEALTEADLIKQLIAIVSDRTGYPADMINEEMDLEADLGIDSIKRLEIFGAMFDQLSAEVPHFQDMEKQKDMETFDIDAFSNIRKMGGFFKQTISELLTELKQGGAAAPAAEAAPVPAAAPAPVSSEPALHETPAAEAKPLRQLGVVSSTKKLVADVAVEDTAAKKSLAEPRETASALAQQSPVSDAHTVTASIHRFQARKQALPKPDLLELAAGRLWLLTDDGKGLSEEVAKQLLAHGQQVARLVFKWQQAKGQRKAIKHVNDYVLERADELALEDVLSRIAVAEGQVGGFIHLQAPAGNVKSLANAFAAAEYDTAQALFLLAKLLQPSLTQPGPGRACFFVASQLDGELGTARRAAFPVAAAGVSGLSKALNIEWEDVFCRTVDFDPKCGKGAIAAMLLEELRDVQSDVAEVGRGVKGERMTLGFEAAPTDPQAVANIDAKTVFLVTGGARGITAECVIALAKRYPARFALLGRTRIDAPPPEWAEGGGELAELKARAIRHLQQQGETVTPVKVDALLKEVLQLAEVRATIAGIEQAGGQAIYLACDIGDAKDVARAAAEAQRQLGPIRGIIHGAGNLADKRIEKKTPADFRSVFHTKVKGLENLLAAVKPDGLRHLVLFSSVSGFFGNAGQTDYAMANDALNKFAYLYQTLYPKQQVRSINWGPWDSGMVNDVLKKAYADRGLAIIPTSVGAQFFVDEFAAGLVPQVIVGGGSYKVGRKQKTLPALTRVERELDPAVNGFLADHVVGGQPVLPATAAAGWMVQLCEDLLPGYRLETLTDFRVLKGVVFDAGEQKRFIAELRPVAEAGGNGDRHTLEVSIFNQVDGAALNRYQARVTMSRLAAEQPADGPQAPTGAPLEHPPLYGDMRDGAWLFHGPAFRGVQTLFRLDGQGLQAGGRLAAAAGQGQFPVNSFNPYLADVALQTPLVWLMSQSDKAGLPLQIAEWRQYAPLAFDQAFYLSMAVTAQTATTLLADVIVHGADGKVYSKLSGLQFTVSKKLRQLMCDPEASVAV